MNVQNDWQAENISDWLKSVGWFPLFFFLESLGRVWYLTYFSDICHVVGTFYAWYSE